MINILFIIDRLTIGGTEGQLRSLIRGLDRERFHPHLCTTREFDHADNSLNADLLNLFFKSFHDVSLISCLKRLNFYIKDNNIQIVQSFFHDPHLLAAISSMGCSVKLICSIRDLGYWRNYRESLKIRIAYPFFDGFIANSYAVKENFIAIDHIKSEKIEVIHNGIPYSTKELINYSEDKINKQPIIGIVANFNREVKRVDDFISAASLVKQQHADARFIIVGEGRLRGQLEALRQSQGLVDSLTLTGQLTDPTDVIRQLTVGVNTSETEGFSNAILEYMAWGVPVVATHNSGNAELVKEGENGFLVPVGDVSAMAERISFLLSNKETRDVISANNMRRVQMDFTLEKMIHAHEAYYERMLSI